MSPRRTYAAIWAQDDAVPVAGSLTLGPCTLTFNGRDLHEDVALGDIDSVSVDRSQGGRVGGRTSLVLGLAGRTIRLGLPEPGALHELCERLTTATA